MQSSWAKYVATQPIINFEILWEQLSTAEVISFDVFNTLLKQDVLAEADVFKIVEQEWSRQHQGELVNNFSLQRQHAEQHVKQQLGTGATLHDIYQIMNVPRDMEQVERKIWHQISCANRPLLELFNALIEIGKRVILVADTFLSKYDVASMLADAGYGGYEKLYVSSEYTADKTMSGLFRQMLQELALESNQLVHVDDNKITIMLAAKNFGLKTCQIPQVIENIKFSAHPTNLVQRSLHTFINNHIAKYEFDSYQEFGYSIFGPVILGFSQWLAREIPKEQKIYFLARDGYVLKAAFDKMYPQRDSNYLAVSRRSLQVPLLENVQNLMDVLAVLNLSPIFTGREFLIACGIDEKDAQIPSLTQKFSRHDKEHPSLVALYQEYSEQIRLNAQHEAKMLRQYLHQMDFEGTTALIDIGWHANKQWALQMICQRKQIDINLHGYYLGVSSLALKKKEMQLAGFWFDQQQSKQKNLAAPISGLLEFLFSANVGTTVTYANDNGEIKPILAPYEYSEEHALIIQGQLLVTIRQAALQFVDDFAKSNLSKLIELDAKDAMLNFEEATFRPNQQFMRRYGHFEFINRNVKYLATPRPFVYYLWHPYQFKNDFLVSRWPIGFLKRLLKLPINYFALYNRLVQYFGADRD